MPYFTRRKLTPLERLEYERRCAVLTEQHLAAFRQLMKELRIELVNAEPYKLVPLQETDNYEIDA